MRVVATRAVSDDTTPSVVSHLTNVRPVRWAHIAAATSNASCTTAKAGAHGVSAGVKSKPHATLKPRPNAAASDAAHAAAAPGAPCPADGFVTKNRQIFVRFPGL